MHKNQILTLSALCLALALMSCDAGGLRTEPVAAGTVYFNMFVDTAIFSANQGKALTFQLAKPNGQIFLQAGNATVKGTLRDAGGAGASGVRNFELKLTHKAAGGAVLSTFTANFHRNADGTIPLQSTPFPGFVLQPNQSLVITARPLDGSLPFSQLKVRLKLIAS